MRHLARHHLVPLLLLALAAPRPARAQAPDDAPLTTAAIARRALPATATIIVLGAAGDTLAQGSAFFVRGDGVLVTNWHVLRGAARAVVVRENGERFDRVAFVDGDSTVDVALVKVPGRALPVLTPRADVPAVGERLVTIGSPLGLQQTVSEGIVSARRTVRGREMVQMTAPISPGSSGGAVLDDRGRVFAISTAYREGGQQLNFAVPIRYALGMLRGVTDERPLAEVFAGGRTRAVAGGATPIGARPRAELAPNAASTTNRALVMPPPTRSPRASVDGTWRIEQHWSGTGQRDGTKDIGFVLARNRVGLLVLAGVHPDGSTAPTRVYWIAPWRTTASGEMAMAAGGVTYGGHQTDSGFALRGRLARPERYDYRLLLLGEPFRFPISDNTGLYSVSARTFYVSRAGVRVTKPHDWRGDAAIAFASGVMHLDLHLTHTTAGGTINLTGKAPFGADGSFRVESADGHVSLDGTLVAGVLRGTWTDIRKDGGLFTGQVEAMRE
ncbi:MAG TPA: S1C family serine protease [Gemmatimonadaceae bacterium]|nr:S1C family serine protease [Gemmatimonadaceae bacterium]